MPDQQAGSPATAALSTKVEAEFVAPLTAIRGALEILRDFPDLGPEERGRFLATALQECQRLEKGVEGLAATVYEAGRRGAERANRTSLTDAEYARYAERVRISEEDGLVEVDFSDFEFTNSKTVHDFFDVIEDLLRDTGRRWYFLIDQHHCSVWPEAWVAFAQCEKHLRETYSLGTARYAETDPGHPNADPSLFGSRTEALAKVEAARAARA